MFKKVLLIGLLKNKKWRFFSRGVYRGKLLSFFYFSTNLILIFILPFALFSDDDQVSRRASNKFAIQTGLANTVYQSDYSHELSASYNFSSAWTAGVGVARNTAHIPYKTEISPTYDLFSGGAFNMNVTEEKRGNHGYAYLHWFLLKKSPIYMGFYGGRYFTGGNKEITSIWNLSPTSKYFFSENYTLTNRTYNYALLTIGAKWYSSSGIYIGGEFGMGYEIQPKIDYNRKFFMNNTPELNTPEKAYLFNYYNKSNPDYNKSSQTYGVLHVYVGYTF